MKQAFDAPYRGYPLESFSFGSNGITDLLAQDTAQLIIEADIMLSDAVVTRVNEQIKEYVRAKAKHDDGETKDVFIRERRLRYRVKLEVVTKSGIIHVVDEYLTALSANGKPNMSRRPFIEQVNKKIHLRMEGQSHPNYYELCLPHTILSMAHHPPHYPHVVAMRTELEHWDLFYFEPREQMRRVSPVKEVRRIGQMGEDLAPFLNTLCATSPNGWEGFKRAIRTILPNITDVIVTPNNKGEVELLVDEGGRKIPARLLSEGTLRIMGLLAMSSGSERPAVIGFEEPENGIHPRRIQLVAKLLQAQSSTGAQVIVTSHSPLLPDLVDDASLLTVRRTKTGTEIKPFVTWGLIGKSEDIAHGLEDHEQATTVSERILRGDFDE